MRLNILCIVHGHLGVLSGGYLLQKSESLFFRYQAQMPQPQRCIMSNKRNLGAVQARIFARFEAHLLHPRLTIPSNILLIFLEDPPTTPHGTNHSHEKLCSLAFESPLIALVEMEAHSSRPHPSMRDPSIVDGGGVRNIE